MTESDKEFLLWIGKRLVYKYRENPEILSIIENIIEKSNSEQSIYHNFFLDTHNTLGKIITDMIKVNKTFSKQFFNAKDQISQPQIEKVNDIFENIDISQMLK